MMWKAFIFAEVDHRPPGAALASGVGSGWSQDRALWWGHVPGQPLSACVCVWVREGVVGWRRAGEWCPFPSESEPRGLLTGPEEGGAQTGKGPSGQGTGAGPHSDHSLHRSFSQEVTFHSSD